VDGVLSQEEINALLNDSSSLTNSPSAGANDAPLSEKEKDAIGEIANISMGTAATTLFSLVNRKVDISTPVVTFAKWDDIVANYEKPCVFIRIGYTVGLDGSNILVLREHDVKVITDLMMGGDGTNDMGELSELHLSAISEAMNQMMGSSATSLSSMLNKVIDISPPQADLVDLQDNVDEGSIDYFLTGEFVKISFRMVIGDLVDSEIMQLYPFSFARDMYESISKNMNLDVGDDTPAAAPVQQSAPASTPAPAPVAQAASAPTQQPQMATQGQPVNMTVMTQPMMDPVNVQPAMFTAFSPTAIPASMPENIDLIMDVPLDVTVELGRTSKSIQEILDFAPGTIIELNKIAGEPIDVLVNGKYVAKGEVVVIEESFGVRITEIVQ